MLPRAALFRLAVSVGVGITTMWAGSSARGDEYGRYYHWPSNPSNERYWTPYQYEQIYNGGYRYPAQMRQYPRVRGWRSWLDAKKTYYRGYHFTLDQF